MGKPGTKPLLEPAKLPSELPHYITPVTLLERLTMTDTTLPTLHTLPTLVPNVRLIGKVDEDMLADFFRQQAQAPTQAGHPVVVELSTSGGDADVGRRIAQEIRMWQGTLGRELFFLGKTYVYSAGITVMASFPQSHRFLTADCELLIHERKLKKEVHLDGALRGCMSVVKDVLAQIESGQRLEKAGFEELVKGSSLSAQALTDKVYHQDWYLTAQEAQGLGLVRGLV